MKKSIFLISLVCLLTLSSFAQTPNFSGEWLLDKGKSKMDERQAASIESQTMKVEQTEKDIKITVTTKQAQGGMVSNGRRVDLGNGKNIYTLDGKEVISERESENGQVLIKNKGEIEDGKLKIQTSHTFNEGAVKITIKEVWTLSDGNTLTVKREAETPQRIVTSELVFTKKS